MMNFCLTSSTKFPLKMLENLAYMVDEETQYGGNFGNIRISEHVLLNQCGTLLI